MIDRPIRSAVMLLPALFLLLLLLLLLAGSCGPEPEVRSPGTSLGRESRSPGGHRDPRHKEKFIKHLTGPLHFSPKCRKHFYRLYHSTRDCTTPEYYKRCARLLTRLANSLHCT
ncbi:ALK and LTK ligand 2b isoform X2 [Gasterosteus aculeatus]|uniref:ALK and LTK ligand 2 isoform X2 n=1 Tax=Gasterosteus aculeatus aculeatus TaxID=481459 RepID=UPI001A995256|nr:ALK and LTK ligand 2 isoform X2 [Gasterosteus aculeatus aculeatus]XP_040025872.1 ALK and LTK ligand 2 isoform X2 [Gasterosteus aculeatus aculeatus]